jgi:hypothetical protein
MIGRTVSHYRVVEKLGGGSMGVVYLAEDTRLGRNAALKFLPPDLTRDPESRERFKREARAASALDHAAICTIYDVDETSDGQLFIAMAAYDGLTLKALLAQGPLPVDEATDIARQIAAGLARAHEQAIVHRDIKPANLMVTRHGEVKILDFGVAKLAGEAGMTRTGASVGTLAYMAPEQADGDEVGPATDLWALGVVLYEMISGRAPFSRSDERATLTAILALDPAPLRSEGLDVPEPLTTLVEELLRKDPAQRPASASEVMDRLEAVSAPTVVESSRGRLPALISALASLTILAVVVFAVLIPRLRGDGGASLIPGVERLAGEGRYAQAYELALEAEERFGADSLGSLMAEVADVLFIETEPSGAEVTIRRFDPDAELTPQAIGSTPIQGLRVARGDYLLRVELAGHRSMSRPASSAWLRHAHGFGADPAIRLQLTLRRLDVDPVDMVFVPAGRYELSSFGLPVGLTADLVDFYIDDFEVTNSAFREFVASGAYSRPELWSEPFEVDGAPVPWPDGVSRFVDRTGLPGPRGWRSGRFPEGEDRHPVSGVTWYEAAAYCAWAGKRLPTAYEWEKTARNGVTATSEIMMPWGFVGARSPVQSRANFSGSGTASVDSYPFGLSPYGAHGMAGNVREWIENESEGERFYAGGSWEDPHYVFGNFGHVEPFAASPATGLRCAVTRREYEDGSFGSVEGQGGGEMDLRQVTPDYEPVERAVFSSLLSHYRYDPRPLEAVETAVLETDDWTRYRLEFDGPNEERVLAYLYLPHQVEPPYQTLVYVPGGTVWVNETMWREVERFMPAHIRAGRAVFAVVMKGLVERGRGAGYAAPPTESVAHRDEIVEQGIEFRIGLDYLESRSDIDMERLAYFAVSRGAASRLPFAGIDDRFSAFVLVGGGIDERFLPTLPEVDPVNFAPHLLGPTLLVNGRQDEEHLWLSRGLPLWNLLSEPKTLELVDGAGHIVPEEVRIPAINGWLDGVFGPTR